MSSSSWAEVGCHVDKKVHIEETFGINPYVHSLNGLSSSAQPSFRGGMIIVTSKHFLHNNTLDGSTSKNRIGNWQ